MKTWAIVRTALVIFAFLQVALRSQVPAPPEGVSLSGLAGIFCVGAFGILFVVGIQRINPLSAPTWRYPRWSVNPFLLREPLQFFHLAGFFFLAAGAGTLLRQFILGPQVELSVFFVPVFGSGILCGVYACTIVYRGKMSSA